MKRKLQRALACLLALALLTCPALAESSFPDVDENADYAEAIEYLNEAGIMQGDENGNFNPDKLVSRAEMATLICRMLGETVNLSVEDTYTDVPISHWANKYIAKAASLGIIGGYGNGRFGPDNTVTYEQVVTMIVRSLSYENEANDAGGYPDGYLVIAQELGLLNGLDAKIGTPLDRANVAAIIYNCYHSYV